MADKLTGKASSFLFNGTSIPISKYSPKSTRKLADTTDSANYDAGTDLIHNSQLPASIQMELSVEGKFSKSKTNAALITQLYSGATAVPTILNLDAGTIYGHGNFDMGDFSADVPVEDTVSWTATFRSNGVFTPGS